MCVPAWVIPLIVFASYVLGGFFILWWQDKQAKRSN